MAGACFLLRRYLAKDYCRQRIHHARIFQRIFFSFVRNIKAVSLLKLLSTKPEKKFNWITPPFFPTAFIWSSSGYGIPGTGYSCSYGSDHRFGRSIDCIPESLFANMRNVNKHSQPVHLGQRLFKAIQSFYWLCGICSFIHGRRCPWSRIIPVSVIPNPC